MKSSFFLWGTLLLVIMIFAGLFAFYYEPVSADIKSNLAIATGTVTGDTPVPYGGGTSHLIKYTFYVNGKVIDGSISVLLDELEELSIGDPGHQKFGVAYSLKNSNHNVLLLTKDDSVKYGLSRHHL